jgi:Restriction endonuclease BglII
MKAHVDRTPYSEKSFRRISHPRMAQRDRRSRNRLPQGMVGDRRILSEFRLLRSEVEAAGGGRSPISKGLDGAFYALGWKEKQFKTSIRVDEKTYESPTHKVDCFKGRVALELEWNNKDPFFDRDLNNFRLLFDLRAIDVGIIVTRATELQQIFQRLGKGASYGASTTHHTKLWPRVEGGGGGGCPILTFAIKPSLYVDDVS